MLKLKQSNGRLDCYNMNEYNYILYENIDVITQTCK